MDSRLRFWSLNRAPGGTINLLRPVEADANTLILLALSGSQPTWQDLLLASSRSKMTHNRQLADRLVEPLPTGIIGSFADNPSRIR